MGRTAGSRRWLLTVALVLVGVGTVAATLMLLRDDLGERTAGPLSGRDRYPGLPELTGGPAARSYLEGPGADLVRFWELTKGLHEEATSEGCARVIEVDLEAVPSPRDLAGLARQVPDPVLAEALLEDLAAKVEMLANCAAGDVVATGRGSTGEVAASTGVVEVLLREAGVR